MEGTHQQGFQIASNYYFKLETQDILDATTVQEENFKVTTAGTDVPVVCDAVYVSDKSEVRLYLTKDIAKYVSLNPYSITSTGVKDTDGGAVTLSGQVYFTPENDCELYDISIANIWFKNGDATYYSQPAEGPCDVNVRIVNSSSEEKTATLKISAIGTDLSSRPLGQEEITLGANEEITKGFKSLSFFRGEQVEIELIK